MYMKEEKNFQMKFLNENRNFWKTKKIKYKMIIKNNMYIHSIACYLCILTLNNDFNYNSYIKYTGKKTVKC